MSRVRCKVDEAIDTYGVRAPGTGSASLGEYLVARWTGADGYRSVGYRQLADWFNRQLLKRVYDEHGRSTLGTRIDSEYAALTGDDDLVRSEVVADLASSGVDADAVVDDMVSPRTMHRHLTGCLDAEKTPRPAQTDWERDSVEMARARLAEKVSKAASSLETKGEIPDADAANVEIGIYLSCPECTTRVPLEIARRRGYVCAAHASLSKGTSVTVEDATTQSSPSARTPLESVIQAVAQFSE